MTQANGQHGGEMTPTTARWVQLVLGFSVSVAVGLAPFLGRLKVPGFTPMLALIPNSLQGIAVPVSAFAMGTVAVLVQWFGAGRSRQAWTRMWFQRALAICVATLIALVVIEVLAVVRVPVPAVDSTATFAVGLGHPNKPPCEGLGRIECIKKLGLDEAIVETYFGETVANLTKLVLVLTYVTLMSSFGIMVGLVMMATAAGAPASGAPSPRRTRRSS